MVTEGGWFPEVWKAITGAPTKSVRHDPSRATEIFELLLKCT